MRLKVAIWCLLFFFGLGPAGVQAQIAGTLDFDTAINRFKYYNGSAWITMGSVILLSSCSASDRGKIEYNTTLSSLVYCNGSTWYSFHGLPMVDICTKAGTWHYHEPLNRYRFCNGLLWVLM